MRILLLDNRDSFTWNLQHLLVQHAAVDVQRNDRITVDEVARYDRIVLSPGPGLPAEAGVLMPVIERLHRTHPMLGVCLGMQALVEHFGGALYNQPRVMHGVAVPCHVMAKDEPLFAGLPDTFDVGLYHSWAADTKRLPAELEMTAVSAAGVVMAVRHRTLPVCGVQFHPESVLTPWGPRIIANWMAL
ncbi:MAG: aminodeoxychorismate/anthranilate synthase component II [Flavobacteriales bacterium]|jgi:anthranilate synthase component 2|nr:aminodeoxychorismate/anthranilate synthase component II [Flavobacteriales bacterium]